jgi:hypothetical protein
MDTTSSRRKFLKTVATGVIGGGVMAQSVFAKSQDSKDGIEFQKGFTVFNETTQKNMMKLAEILIPGCSSIGMKDKLMNYLRTNKGVASFFDAGFWNVNAICKTKFKTPFYSLEDKDSLEKITKYVSIRNRSFFINFKKLVVEFYYSDPKVWKRLSYNGPPQPNGFMNYAEPPKPAKKS